ncbi:582_t:CDS:2, partial [Dentiscutata heterogama]
FAGTGNIIQGHKQPYKVHEQSGVDEPPSRLRKRNHSTNYAESSSREESNSDYEEKSKRVKNEPIRSLNEFSSSFPKLPDDDENDESESEAITRKLNKLKKRLEAQPRNDWIVGTINVSKKFKEFQIQLIENVINGRACNNIAIGLDGNFILNDGSDLGKKASRVFNNLKEDLPSVQIKRTTENEHRFNYLDPLLRPFFCGDSKDYEIRMDKSVNGSLKRPDFSCRINDITILNSEIKPLGCTELQKNKDFVKVHLRSKRSINQLLNEGGPNQSIIFLNMGDDVNSYVMDLQYDGIYRSCPLLATKLVTEKALFPMLVLSVYHIDKIEQHVQGIASEFMSRRSSQYNYSEQIGYMIEELSSSEFKELL